MGKPSARRLGKVVLVAVAVIALAAALAVRFEARRAGALASPTKARQHDRGVPVRTALVADETVDAVIGAPGVTAASQRVSVRLGADPILNRFNPVLTKVHVRDGSYVKVGDPLFELDAACFERNVAQARKALEAAQAEHAWAQAAVTENATSRQVELDAATSELEFRKTDVEFRREDHERLLNLHQDGNASLREYLEAASAYAEARYHLTLATSRHQLAKAEMVLGPLRDRHGLDAAAQQVEAAGLEQALAEADLARCRLTSPLDGLVDKVASDPGQIVDVNTTLADVLKTDPIHVQVDFPQERMGEVRLGMSAEVTLDSFAGETFEGRVIGIGARVDAETRVLPVLVELPNPSQRIKVGVSGYVRIKVTRDAVTVPAIAVIGIEPEAMAFVVEDGHARIRHVRTGPVVNTGYREVAQGLAPGDQVVIYGQQYLRDGEPVDTDWRQWSRRE